MAMREPQNFVREREFLRARRARTRVDPPADAGRRLIRRVSAWIAACVAALTPAFVTAIIFGWITLRLALEMALWAGSCVLAVAGMLAAVKLRSAFRNASSPSA
jgi:hypothetical protein